MNLPNPLVIVHPVSFAPQKEPLFLTMAKKELCHAPLQKRSHGSPWGHSKQKQRLTLPCDVIFHLT